jgi:3',5'-cyclic AMP phosphodiesterase CpdA
MTRLTMRIFLRLLGCSLALCLAGCAHMRSPVSRSFSFVQMGDPQLGFNGYEADMARFQAAVKQINELKPDFVVVCGDLVNKAKPETYIDFKKLKAGFAMPCYCAPGNHDVDNQPTPFTLKRYRTAMGKDYFSFDHLGFTFVILDSQLWKSPLVGETEKQDAWFKNVLDRAARKGNSIVLVEHFPFFHKHPDEPDDYYNLPLAKRKELMATCENAGVKAIVAGHTHRTLLLEFGGIQMVTSENTSRCFDKRPWGFRLWHADSQGHLTNEFVELKQ